MGSKLTFVHCPAHSVEPPEHDSPHWPFEQTSPGAQACPQPPQWAGSNASCVHRSSQSVAPGHVGAPPPAPVLAVDVVVDVVVPAPVSPPAPVSSNMGVSVAAHPAQLAKLAATKAMRAPDGARARR